MDKKHENDLTIFAGRSHPELTLTIADCLGIDLRDPERRDEFKNVKFKDFSNENIMVMIEENVREKDVFLIQTSASPVNKNIIEMLIFIDALKHASAGRITAVIPYFPYARSDKKDRPRISIAARLMADLIQTAGAQRVLTMDLHSPQIQGFFHIPVDQLLAAPVFFEYFKENLITSETKKDFVLLMGDVGAAKHFDYYMDELKIPIAIVDKVRDDNSEKPYVKGIIGDVKGKEILIIDDEIATGGTLIEVVEFLEKNKIEYKKIYAAAVHPVFTENAVERLYHSKFEKVFVANTIPVKHKIEKFKATFPPGGGYKDKFVVLDGIASLFAQAIKCIHTGEPMSQLFPPSVRRKR